MQRVTVTLDDELMRDLDRLIAARGYGGRSEAIRDLARAGLAQTTEAKADTPDCVGALIYIYDHSKSDLTRKLIDKAHHSHDLMLATMHVHLDEKRCLEISVLRGKTSDVQHYADHVIAERGIRHGRVITLPIRQNTR